MTTHNLKTPLHVAAQAVLDRWNSPMWEWSKQSPTADLMHALQEAIAQTEQPTTKWVEAGYRHQLKKIDDRREVLTKDLESIVETPEAEEPQIAKKMVTPYVSQAHFDRAFPNTFIAQPDASSDGR